MLVTIEKLLKIAKNIVNLLSNPNVNPQNLVAYKKTRVFGHKLDY